MRTVSLLTAPAEELEQTAAKELHEVEKMKSPEMKLMQDLPAVRNLSTPMEPATSGTWA